MEFMQGAREEVSDEIENLNLQIIDNFSGRSRKIKRQATIFKSGHKSFQDFCLKRLC